MFKKTKNLRKNLKPGSGTIVSFYWGIGIPLMLALNTDIPKVLSGFLIFIGVLLGSISAFLFEKNNTLKRKYISLIENQRVLSLDEISQICSLPYEKVSNDINKMIERGYFENIYLDFSNRKIIISNNNIDINTKVIEKSVTCPSCGATCKVDSLGNNKCEYCGTALN